MAEKIKTIAVLTSGGDAPGMNAAIRAVVRTAIVKKVKVLAINGGFEGMIEGNFVEMDAGSVSNIIHKGGTIIKTSRSPRFRKKQWRKVAYEQLKKAGVGGVVIIGGNGSLAGAHVFTSEFDMPFIGIPKTIDNDIYGTDYSIGFDTATNTALEAIDKIRDTANSHHRLFFVEVMGRDMGFIALHCGISSGAEMILVPENKNNISELMERLERGWARHKSSMIVVVAEGAVKGGVNAIAEKVKAKFKQYEIRISVLGYFQRGGNPSCFDRFIASLFGNHAVKALLSGKRHVLVGLQNNQITYTALRKVSEGKHHINKKLLDIANELSC